MSYSRTAEYMALFRAIEHARGARTRLFADPYARRFLGRRLRWVASVARLPGGAETVAGLIDRRWPGARSSGVARTRSIDERVTEAVAVGIRQLVLLGAGFDCRAHRLRLDGIRVFEVDRAETQARKRAIAPRSDRVVYVAADLEQVAIADALRGSGFDARKPAIVLWEGVTNYLGAEAVDATLRGLAGLCVRGSELVFTYVHAGILDGSFTAPERERLFARLARSGESWTFGLRPEALGPWLAERGWTLGDDVGAADLRGRYRMERPEEGYRFYRTVTARRISGAPGG